MYDVTITNNYLLPVGGQPIVTTPLPPNTGTRSYSVPPNGGTQTITGMGNLAIEIPCMGTLLCLDIGSRKLDAYTNDRIPWTKHTWGGVVRYRGMDAYFRYEGTGKVNIVIDRIGSINLTFPLGGMRVTLDDLIVS